MVRINYFYSKSVWIDRLFRSKCPVKRGSTIIIGRVHPNEFVEKLDMYTGVGITVLPQVDGMVVVVVVWQM